MRPQSLLRLLGSVASQTVGPNEIIVVDGSINWNTKQALQTRHFSNLRYFMVPPEERGLTRQRNFGIGKVADGTDIVFFLDDDTVLEPDYFGHILSVYERIPNALGVGGYISNEVKWNIVNDGYRPKVDEFVYDGWKRKDSRRFILRKKFGLDSDVPPGWSPQFSNGRSVGFLPPSGKIYQVQQLMGGVSSFRFSVFSQFAFSTYFEGYGLYEDADFTFRVSKVGPLYVNTQARLGHFHDFSGRPNKYKYGRMVVRNGWYVWRVNTPSPTLKAQIKWHAIVLLLMAVRFGNIVTTKERIEAAREGLGRLSGYLSLLLNRPKIT